MVNDFWCHIFRRAVFAVVLLRQIQFQGVPEITNADLIATGPRHEDVLRLKGRTQKKETTVIDNAHPNTKAVYTFMSRWAMFFWWR